MQLLWTDLVDEIANVGEGGFTQLHSQKASFGGGAQGQLEALNDGSGKICLLAKDVKQCFAVCWIFVVAG